MAAAKTFFSVKLIVRVMLIICAYLVGSYVGYHWWVDYCWTKHWPTGTVVTPEGVKLYRQDYPLSYPGYFWPSSVYREVLLQMETLLEGVIEDGTNYLTRFGRSHINPTERTIDWMWPRDKFGAAGRGFMSPTFQMSDRFVNWIAHLQSGILGPIPPSTGWFVRYGESAAMIDAANTWLNGWDGRPPSRYYTNWTSRPWWGDPVEDLFTSYNRYAEKVQVTMVALEKIQYELSEPTLRDYLVWLRKVAIILWVTLITGKPPPML